MVLLGGAGMVRGSPPRRPAPPVTPREPHPKLWGAGGNLRPIPRCWGTQSSGRAGFVSKPGTNRVKVSAAEGREFGVSKGGEGVKPPVGPAGRRSRPTALLWGRKGRAVRGSARPGAIPAPSVTSRGHLRRTRRARSPRGRTEGIPPPLITL